MPIYRPPRYGHAANRASLADPARRGEPDRQNPDRQNREKQAMPPEPKTLQRVDYTVANDGEASRITLTTADGQELTFELTYRQLGRFIEPLRAMAGDMRDRLLKKGEKLKAEVLAELSEARTVEAVLFAVDETTGEQVMSIEGKDLGVLALRLPDGVAAAIAEHLGGAARTRH